VALSTGGRNDPKDWRQVFDPEGEQIKYHQELWSRAVMAAIGIYLLDLLLRRVRLFDRKFLPARRERRKVTA
jgi:Ca-activated chloride channel homolog